MKSGVYSPIISCNPCLSLVIRREEKIDLVAFVGSELVVRLVRANVTHRSLGSLGSEHVGYTIVDGPNIWVWCGRIPAAWEAIRNDTLRT
jgi:hypothetical protein